VAGGVGDGGGGGGPVSGGEDSNEIGAAWTRIGSESLEPDPLLTRCGHSSDLAGPAARRPWRLDGRHGPVENPSRRPSAWPLFEGLHAGAHVVPALDVSVVLVPVHAPKADSGPDLVVVGGSGGGGGGGGDAYGDRLTIANPFP
jgi:uncharacterized protein (DUF736 family)